MEPCYGHSFSKENIKKFFNDEAETRNGKSVKQEWKVNARKSFLEIIKKDNKKTLLEIGAGAGYDSLFFMNNGLNVIAIDISAEMVKKCKDKNIEAYELDFYDLSSLNRKFDCIYSLNTFLYVPKKDLPKVIEKINSILNTDGLFYIGLYGGNDTVTEMVFGDVSDVPLFLAFHSEHYLKSILRNTFEVISFEHISIDNRIDFDTFYSIVLRKASK